MNILGIGILFSRGRGINSFEDALISGWQSPEEYDIPHINKKLPAYIVRPEYMDDKALFKKMRRADKFSKMAVIAAADAVKDSGIDIKPNRTGIILSTAFGAHQTTFDFLDGIIDFGEEQASPTTFSNSVHNAAASYIASSLEIMGPTLTVTRFFFPFQGALQLAQTWLNENICEYVIAGAVDVCGEVMRYCFDKKLGTSEDGKIRPFDFSHLSPPVPGEGSVFYLLSNRSTANAYCKIEGIVFNEGFVGHPTLEVTPPGSAFPPLKIRGGEGGVMIAGKENMVGDVLNIIDSDGMTDTKAYLKSLSPFVPVTAYSPLFGSTMTGSAFNCTAGALMIRNQMQYGAPVIDNPDNLKIADVNRPAKIDLIRSIGCNCLGENVNIYLRKTGM